MHLKRDIDDLFNNLNTCRPNDVVSHFNILIDRFQDLLSSKNVEMITTAE